MKRPVKQQPSDFSRWRQFELPPDQRRRQEEEAWARNREEAERQAREQREKGSQRA